MLMLLLEGRVGHYMARRIGRGLRAVRLGWNGRQGAARAEGGGWSYNFVEVVGESHPNVCSVLTVG
jgi:hypothetical protein